MKDLSNIHIDVRWADVDLNHHVRHSAYYDYGAHARMYLFQKMGYDVKSMMAERLGPVLFEEKANFIRELRLGEEITINVKRGDVTPDGSRWQIHHEIFNTKGHKAAHITVKGAWMDTSKRKLTVPPERVVEAFSKLPAGEPYKR